MNVRSHMTNFSHWCHSRITNKIKSKLFRRVPLGLALPGRHSLVPRPRPTQACRQQRLETTAPRSPRCIETIIYIYKGLPSRSSRHFWKPQQTCYTATLNLPQLSSRGQQIGWWQTVPSCHSSTFRWRSSSFCMSSRKRAFEWLQLHILPISCRYI